MGTEYGVPTPISESKLTSRGVDDDSVELLLLRFKGTEIKMSLKPESAPYRLGLLESSLMRELLK
jgi:hypothetical protein